LRSPTSCNPGVLHGIIRPLVGLRFVQYSADHMCGIAGLYRGAWSNEALGPLLERMSRTLVHRGPDDCHQVAVPAMRAGLAVRRLSLVDLAGGRQPLENEDGTVVLACNGEIHNHHELRAELRAQGHRFRTQSDCEVSIAFASEARALLETGIVTPAPDWEGIDSFLAFGYTPAPRSCFTGLERLPAGSYLVAEYAGVQRGFFWRCRYGATPEPQDPARDLEGRLRAAVRRHLAADVPVGVFLSGGWDSSLVTVLAAAESRAPLKTFTIALPENPAYDETRWARQVAAQVGSEHVEVEFRNADLPQLIHRVVRAIEEPCVTSPATLLYALSARAVRDVKAVLSGEGSDELFGGYPWLRADAAYSLRRVMPRHLARALGRIVQSERWRRFSRVAAADSDEAADREWLRLFTADEIPRLAAARPRNPVNDGRLLELDPETRASCEDRLQRRLALELTRRLADGLLLVADKVSMAHSLEVRMPFLDREVIDFALALPSRWKIRDGQEKYVLEPLTRLLPPDVAARRKHALVLPIRACRGAATRVGALRPARRCAPILAIRCKDPRAVAGVAPVRPPGRHAARLGPGESAGLVGVPPQEPAVAPQTGACASVTLLLVDQRQQRAAVTPPLQVLDERLDHAAGSTRRTARGVRRDDHAWMRPEDVR
jgi:asparagine synthase (glutamine-hydrolysing)